MWKFSVSVRRALYSTASNILGGQCVEDCMLATAHWFRFSSSYLAQKMTAISGFQKMHCTT